jgi:hypothetical protein
MALQAQYYAATLVKRNRRVLTGSPGALLGLGAIADMRRYSGGHIALPWPDNAGTECSDKQEEHKHDKRTSGVNGVGEKAVHGVGSLSLM